ncbi:MAG TPA: hypothetical protein VG708_02235 [Mycobacteriales bacterium]|nr:hypothetical protein [Mycobacteriales bacterium]
MRATLTIPGAPLDDQLVDLGGPTAQAALDTLGTSTGYAALPDPGALLNSAPGLLTGLLGQGLAGLPPIKLGKLPSYPVEVASSVSQDPTVSTGVGPYRIAAASTTTSSTATATGGLQSGISGNVALLTSHAAVATSRDGTVTASASSTVQGLAVGPLTIGEITSSASETLAPDGTLTPTSAVRLVGVSVGGIAVAITGNGLDIASTTVPLPVGSLLSGLLDAAHISVKVLPAQTGHGRVIAPALQVTMPLKTSIGSGPGTVRLVVGSTTAALTAASAGAASEPGDDASIPTTTSRGPGTQQPTRSAAGPPAVSPVGSAGHGSVTAPTVAQEPTATAARDAALLDLFDTKTLYLALAGLAICVFVLGQLVRLLGVRGK